MDSLIIPAPDPATGNSGLPVPFVGARWYPANDAKCTVHYPIDRGAATGAVWVSLDSMADAEWFLACQLMLLSGERTLWSASISSLAACQTRWVARLPDDLSLASVDAAVVVVRRKRPGAARLALGPLTFTSDKPAPLLDPALPKGPLLDAFGQSRLRDWPGKTESECALRDRLLNASEAPAAAPTGRSRWGGDAGGQRVAATGFFRTHHDGRRWWLVDPDGYRFWSCGACCVHPLIDHETRYETQWVNLRGALAWMPDPQGEFAAAYDQNPWHAKTDKEFNFLAANFIRVFGSDAWREKWEQLTFAELTRIGFNTAGDWSDIEACARTQVPYTRPLELHLRFHHTPSLVGSLPDVFHNGLEKDAARYAEQLRDTVGDPALLGYFLHNEPGWWFDDGLVSPAEQMLRKNVSGESRTALVDFLRKRYSNETALQDAWGAAATFAALAGIAWSEPFTPSAIKDLHEFSTIMLRRMIDTLSRACRRVDPNHLNLGVRWWTFPPPWALAAMGSADVISFNCYQPVPNNVHYDSKQPLQGTEAIFESLNKPVLIGEWHFGALDAGLASAGLYGVRNQEERGKAYRRYLEHAASLPWCVGVHWFNLYDRNVLYSQQDNENYNIGFMDLTQRRHEPLCAAARASHERLYDVAAGRQPPFDEPVDYIHPSR